MYILKAGGNILYTADTYEEVQKYADYTGIASYTIENVNYFTLQDDLSQEELLLLRENLIATITQDSADITNYLSLLLEVERELTLQENH